MVKIYKQPFAHDGDAIAIPDASQPDGKMSSADGWTTDYQLPKTDPNYKPVGRQEMNGVFKEVTEALGEIQQFGFAKWQPMTWPQGARVVEGGVVYRALTQTSQQPPHADWVDDTGGLVKLTGNQTIAGVKTFTSFPVTPSAAPTDDFQVVNKKYVEASKYELCEFYFWRHPILKPGFQPATGGILENAATLYPEAWAYLQTEEGQLLCKTESEWQAMTHAIWHTNADGTKVGWNGIGGAPFYVLDVVQKTIRLPDLRGMYAEAAGLASLGVGGTHGDGMRRLLGEAYWGLNGTGGSPGSSNFGGFNFNGIFSLQDSGLPSGISTGTPTYSMTKITVDSARTTPSANKVQPRAYGVLACVYLGIPR